MRVTRWIALGAMTTLMLAGTAVPIAGQGSGDGSPVFSAGCGTSSIGAESRYDSGFEELGDVARRWKLDVPHAHDGSSPLPLVILLHGLGEGPTEIELETGFGRYGKEQGFVVVTPQALGPVTHWVQDFAEVFIDVTPANPDVIFIDALLDRLGEELCLDLSRVYATGFSNGGMATSALTCALEERIAAFAPVAGLVDFGEDCVQDRPVPLLAFYGTDDPAGLYEGGFGAALLAMETGDGVPWGELPMLDDPIYYVSVPDRAAGFAARNGCAPGPGSELIAKDVERISWDCPDGAAVALITAHGDGHSWPGSEYVNGGGPLYKSTMEIDATEMIWDFFSQHQLPAE